MISINALSRPIGVASTNASNTASKLKSFGILKVKRILAHANGIEYKMLESIYRKFRTVSIHHIKNEIERFASHRVELNKIELIGRRVHWPSVAANHLAAQWMRARSSSTSLVSFHLYVRRYRNVCVACVEIVCILVSQLNLKIVTLRLRLIWCFRNSNCRRITFQLTKFVSKRISTGGTVIDQSMMVGSQEMRDCFSFHIEMWSRLHLHRDSLQL